MFYIILFLDFEDLSIFGFLLKKYIIKMCTLTQTQTEPAMIRIKYKPNLNIVFVNTQIRFKFLTLKMQNLNRSIKS